MKKELIRKLLMKVIRELDSDRFKGRKPSVEELEEILEEERQGNRWFRNSIRHC